MNLHKLEPVLNVFPAISLDEVGQGNVNLLNRIDSKYLLLAADFDKFIEVLKKDYRILEIDGQRIHTYETLYFDTDDYELYNMHHNGRGNRTKVRIRKYGVNNLIFLEVKKKTNKSVTVKKRIPLTYIPQNLLELKSIIEAEGIDIEEETLKPQLWTIFKRMTFVNPERRERLTIDVDLHLIDGKTDLSCEDLVIVELKREKTHADSPILDLMKSLQIREQGFSKYTIGTALINGDVKKNNFKLKLYELRNRFSFQPEPVVE